MNKIPIGDVPGLELDENARPQQAQSPPTGECEGPYEDLPVPAKDQPVSEGNVVASVAPFGAPAGFTKVLISLGTTGFAVFAITYLVYRVLDLYIAYRNTHPALAVAYLAASGLITVVVVVVAGRSWFRYVRVKKMNTFQSLAAQARLRKTGEAQNKKLLRMIRSYATRHGRTGPASTRRDANRLCAKLSTYEDAWQAVSDLEEYLLQTMDRRADQIVLQRASQTVLGTAIAGGRMDGLIVLWQAMSLVSDIATLYAGRPGFLGTVRLLRRTLAMTVMAEIAEQATELLADVVANKVAAKLGGRAARGFGNGLLMVRLGNALKKQCRPVQYAGSRLSAMALATELLGTFKNRNKSSPALDGEEA